MKSPIGVRRVLIALLWCVIVPACVGQSEQEKPQAAQDTLYDKSYALVIGVSYYKSPKSFHDLPNAEADARAVAEYLTKTGFEVKSLYGPEATKTAIQNALAGRDEPSAKPKSIRSRIGANDRVIIFFAGHGDAGYENGKYMGFIVPWDAEEGDVLSYVNMTELKLWGLDYLRKAKHVLFILDSCYGGSVASATSPDDTSGMASQPYTAPDKSAAGAAGQELRSAARKGVESKPVQRDYVHKIAGLRAREALTAGGKEEQVADGTGGHSLFTGKLLSALRDGSLPSSPEGYITFAELWGYIQQYASNNIQTPQANKLEGDEGGDFVFTSLSPQRRIGILRNFQPADPAMEQSELQNAGADFLHMELQDQIENGRVKNVKFDIADATQLGTANAGQSMRGPQTSSAVNESTSRPYDYQLEVKYSLLGNKRARMEVRFKNTGKDLAEIEPVTAEISTEDMKFDQLARNILKRFVPEVDLHLHLEKGTCKGCADDLSRGIQSAIESWLANFKVARIKYVEEEDNDAKVDVRIRPSMWIERTGNREVLKAMMSVHHAASGQSQTFKAQSDPAKWPDAMKQLQQQVESYVSGLVKQF